MTTAHRPTWAPAKGGDEQGGMRFYAPSKMQSVKDMAAHTKLKFRQEGQHTAGEITKKDLRAELEEKERKHFINAKGANFDEEKEDDFRLLEAAPPGGGGHVLVPKAIDADDSDEDESESDSDDDDEDDEAELLAELERIKRERAEEAARKAALEAERNQKEQEAELMHGNPLLQGTLAAGDATFTMKRRWDDDVVFRNQARSEPKQQRRFINDTIRSDFHHKFLEPLYEVVLGLFYYNVSLTVSYYEYHYNVN